MYNAWVKVCIRNLPAESERKRPSLMKTTNQALNKKRGCGYFHLHTVLSPSYCTYCKYGDTKSLCPFLFEKPTNACIFPYVHIYAWPLGICITSGVPTVQLAESYVCCIKGPSGTRSGPSMQCAWFKCDAAITFGLMFYVVWLHAPSTDVLRWFG